MWPYLEKNLCTCNRVKSFEMRSSWIMWVGPKSSDKCLCLYKGKVEGNLRWTEEKEDRREIMCRLRQRWGWCGHEPKKPRVIDSYQKLGGKEGFFLESLAEEQPCWRHDFGLVAFRTMREYTFFCLSHLVCGNFCCGSPRKLNYLPTKLFSKKAFMAQLFGMLKYEARFSSFKLSLMDI